MALTYSKMLELGFEMPEFRLLNTVDNSWFDSKNLPKNKAKLVMFICNHCPFVIYLQAEILRLAQDYFDKISIVAISANDALQYPQDAPQEMTKLAQKLGFNFPYLFDERQEIAKAFNAACTPEFYLFNTKNKLIYRGRFDDSTPQNQKKPSGNELRAAINCFLENKEISKMQNPSMGCNIKWKS